MKRKLLLLLILPLFCCCSQSSEVKEAENVIKRAFGKMPRNVEFIYTAPSDSLDSYALSVTDGKLTVEGTSPVAICKGFYDYILQNGYGISSWTGNRLDMPSRLPEMERKEVVSPFRDRLYYNVCTYGYTTPFWDWKKWEQELDWIALHGFDMPLAPIAGEAIFARVWEKLGLSYEEIDEYFSGPAHMPWMRMGNMSELDGGLSREWHEEQIALQHKILDRMRSLGMTPVCQGFAGFVPKAMKKHYPEIDMTTMEWCGFESYIMSPLDSLFSVIGTEFIREWEKEFGKCRYYLVDSFNEMDIPFGEKGSQERFDKLQHYGKTIYNSIASANPDAVWVLQGWMFGYQRSLWDPQSVEALLTSAPEDKLMVIDLAVDFNEFQWRNANSWDHFSGFYDRTWIWSTVPNFGGRTALKGPLEFYLNGHLEAVNSPNRGHLTGYGTSPEGIENNEIVYELISAAGWSSEEKDLAAFLESYNKARYGVADPAFTEFWAKLRTSVYDNFTNNARFLWQQRPAYHRKPNMNLNDNYFKGIESFLSVADQYKDNELYVTDAIQYAALYLSAKAEYFLKAADWAIVAGNITEAESCKDQLIEMLLEIDRLLESHPILRMQRWMDMAEEFATCPAEEESFVREAKRLVSTWGGTLKDYSARVWSGLIRDYYVPRLEEYFSCALQGKVSDRILEIEAAFHESLPLSEIEPYENPLEAAIELVKKYSDVEYYAVAKKAPVDEIGFFCPQDFNGKAETEVYLSMENRDYKDIMGLCFKNERGDDVRIKKIFMRTGPNHLGTWTPDVRLKAGESFYLPHKGPGTLDGLEKEIKIFLTLEGTGNSYGTVSYCRVEDQKEHFTTPVKSQGYNCCCWDFAGTSILESEIYRQHGKVYDLSEMWIARHAYYEKAVRHVRHYGKNHYRCGGIHADVMAMVKKYGVVPQEVYDECRKTDGKYDHRELVDTLRSYLADLVKMKNGTMKPDWLDDIDAILDEHMGARPEKFIYKGREYTPLSFAQSLGIDFDDYVTVTSFSCYDVNSWFAMEIPDNWRWSQVFNTDFETYKKIADYALARGYTVGVAADFSDPTIKNESRNFLKIPADCGDITWDLRTRSYLNHYTTDDHAVHLIGTAMDHNGEIWYKLKDSSGRNGRAGREGFNSYMSKPYLHYKSTSMFLHKDALPESIKSRL